MKRIFIFFVFFLFVLSIAFSEIGIMEPHAGVVWCKGNTYEINWLVLGKVHPVSKLRLYNASGTVKIMNIMNKIPTSQGFFPWKIPMSIPDGMYVIRIKTLDNKVFATSAPFTIKTCGTSSSSVGKIIIFSPVGGDVWLVNKIYQIRWNFSGKIGSFIKIRLFKKGSNQKVLNITNSVSIASKVFNWKIPQNIAEGDYYIRIKTVDNKVFANSNVFRIEKGIVIVDPENTLILEPSKIIQYKFYSPQAGSKWAPMKFQHIHFALYIKNMPGEWPSSWTKGWNVKLVSVDNSLFKPFLIGSNYRFDNEKLLINPSKVSKGYEEFDFFWKFEPYYNIPSGKYKLMLESMANPSIRFYSGVFSVENKISSNTGFIQGKTYSIDIVDVFFNYYEKAIFVKVKNFNYPLSKFELNANFKNSSHCAYAGVSECLENKSFSISKNISISAGALETYKLVNYKCFDNRPADFIPILGPLEYTISIYEPVSKKVLVEKSGFVCKTKKSDIIIRSEIMFVRNDGYYSSLSHNKKGVLYISDFKKIPGGFEAYVDVDAQNYGCSSRTFRIGLFMDGPYLNGKKAVSLGWFTLKPGESKFLRSEKPIKFTIPRNGQYYKIVLIADPAEEKNEGYPNAYMNNFVMSYVRVED